MTPLKLYFRTLTATILGPVLFSLLLAGTITPPPADAHPHLFIVQRLTAIFDSDGLAGFRVHWKMDDTFAEMIVLDYDANKNGVLEAEEVAEIEEKAFSYISNHDYFCFIKIEDQPFQVQYVKDFNAVLEDGRLTYEFTVPCHVAATEQVKRIAVSTYDPTYYTAVFFAANEPVSLTGADAYDVTASVKEDPDTKIYYDMIHPWTLFLEFRKKS